MILTEIDDWDDLEEPNDHEALLEAENARALTPLGIAEANAYALAQYDRYRQAADAVTDAWHARPDVLRVTLIGSLAIMPWKEVPRHSPYRQERIEIWHECGDVDLAVWLSGTQDLNGLRRSRDRALRDLYRRTGNGTAPHQFDIFVLEPGTDRYLGRLCDFNTCPKGRQDCRVSGCGMVPFLKQHAGFRWRPDSLAADRSHCLFERASGYLERAADLPLPGRPSRVGG